MNQNFSAYILQKRKYFNFEGSITKSESFFIINFFETRFIFWNGKKLNLKSTKNRKQNVGQNAKYNKINIILLRFNFNGQLLEITL